MSCRQRSRDSLEQGSGDAGLAAEVILNPCRAAGDELANPFDPSEDLLLSPDLGPVANTRVLEVASFDGRARGTARPPSLKDMLRTR